MKLFSPFKGNIALAIFFGTLLVFGFIFTFIFPLIR